MSAPPAQSNFAFPAAPQPGGTQSYYPPPPRPSSTATTPPSAATPSYSSPPQHTAQMPTHMRSPSGFSQSSSPSQPHVFTPPSYPEEGATDQYPPEKQHTENLAPSLMPSPSAGMITGAPAPGHFVGAGAVVDDVGTFNGGSYRISHRDSNTLLTIQLAIGCPLHAKPGKWSCPKS